MDYETCLKCYTLPFIPSDKLPNITLKYELDLIIYAQISLNLGIILFIL